MANLKDIVATLAILSAGTLVLTGCEKGSGETTTPDEVKTDAPADTAVEAEASCSGDSEEDAEASCSGEGEGEGEGEASCSGAA